MLWIKAAQIISLRSDLAPPGFDDALLKMADQGVASPFPEIRKIVEAELGGPIDQWFDRFNQNPFAAATVSQIHSARLRREGRWVAVKVQQPYARRLFEQDLRLIRWASRLLEALSIGANLQWNGLFHELREIVVKELNYRYEAASLQTLKKNLKGQPVYVPDIFPEYCGERTLTMEFIRAALLSDCIAMARSDPSRLQAWLAANNIDLRKAAGRLFRAVYRQIFEDDFFHGDLHPGNVILLRDSNLAVIDCRSAGSMDRESLAKLRLYLKAISEREYAMAADLFFLLAARLPVVDLTRVKADLVRAWRSWETRVYVSELPYAGKSLTDVARTVNAIAGRQRFAAQWSMSRLEATLANLDAALAFMDPELNYIRQLRQYFAAAESREAGKRLRQAADRLTDSWEALREVTARADELALFQDAVMRRQAQAAQGATTKLGHVAAAFLAFVSTVGLAGGLFLAIVFAGQRWQWPLEDALGAQLAAVAEAVPGMHPGWQGALLVGSVWLFFSARAGRRRYARAEVRNRDTVSY